MADIGPKTTSDRAWVNGTALWRMDDGRGYNWSLNQSLLQDSIAVSTIQSEIKQFFKLNTDCEEERHLKFGGAKNQRKLNITRKRTF